MNKKRLPVLVLIVIVLCGAVHSVQAQSRVLPFYTLPAAPSWVSFNWKFQPGDSDVLKQGKLRIDLKGVLQVDGSPFQHVQVTRDTQAGEQTVRRRIRVLVKSIPETQQWLKRSDVVSATELSQAEAPANALQDFALERFLGLGLKVDDTGLELVTDSDLVETGLGQFSCRHLKAVSNVGNRKLIYHGWVNDALPFGLVRFEIHEQRGTDAPQKVFTAQVAAKGP